VLRLPPDRSQLDATSMSARVRRVLVLSIACAAAYALWCPTLSEKPLKGSGLAKDMRSASPVAIAPPQAIAMKSSAQSLEPSVKMSFSHNQTDLIAGKLWSANHGSREAMRYLGNALRACSFLGAREDTRDLETEAPLQFSIAQQLYGSAVRTTRPDEALAIVGMFGSYRALLDFCEQLSAAQTDSWARWLESAALIGDTDAMRDYLKFASQDRRAGEENASSSDDTERRAQVRQYSEYLLESGDCGSLGPLSASVDDNELAFSYQIALVAVAKQDMRMGGGNPAEMAPLDNFLADRASHFTDEQKQSAQNRAAYVLHTYCGM
jgi:hypothetical protein